MKDIHERNDGTDVIPLTLKIQEYRNDMAEATLMVPVTTLKTNASINWLSKWRETKTGCWTEK